MRDERYDGAMVWSDLKVSKAIFEVNASRDWKPVEVFQQRGRAGTEIWSM